MFASSASIRAALEVLAAGFDRARLSGDEAVAVVRDMGVIRNLADAIAGQAAIRIEETGAHHRRGHRSPADTAARAFGVGAGEARRLKETAEKVAALPAVDAEVRAGRLPARDARRVADALAVAPWAERRVLSAARQGSRALREECAKVRAEAEDPAQRSARQHRDRSMRWWTDDDGMVNGRIRLAPEVGGLIAKWFEEAGRRVFRARRTDAECERETHEAYQADVFVELVRRRQAWERRRGAAAPDGTSAGDAADLVVDDVRDGEGTEPLAGVPDGDVPDGRHADPDDLPGGAGTSIDLGFDLTVHVCVDHPVLVLGEALGGTTCEIPGVGPVNARWVRSLLGDAFLTAVIKHGRDIRTVAHFGRHIPAELRTALVVSGRECDIEGCHISGYLEIDHEHDFAKGGPTSWENLGWLCARHHKMKTGGWELGPRDPVTRKRILRPPDDARRRAAAA